MSMWDDFFNHTEQALFRDKDRRTLTEEEYELIQFLELRRVLNRIWHALVTIADRDASLE